MPGASRRSGSTITACLGGEASTRMWASVVVVVFVIPLLAAQVEFGTFSESSETPLAMRFRA